MTTSAATHRPLLTLRARRALRRRLVAAQPTSELARRRRLAVAR